MTIGDFEREGMVLYVYDEREDKVEVGLRGEMWERNPVVFGQIFVGSQLDEALSSAATLMGLGSYGTSVAPSI